MKTNASAGRSLFERHELEPDACVAEAGHALALVAQFELQHARLRSLDGR